jgi:broad specificity phosphatase PhoE
MMPMAELHPALLLSQALLPRDVPLILLTRHSVREQAVGGFAGYDLQLTPEGVALAEWWGGRLGRTLSSLHSSPVQRCVDTALALARGAGVELPVQQTANLVEPGCFVSHMHRVGPLFLELGAVSFANRHFEQPLEGVLSPQDGTAKLLRHLFASQGEPRSLTVHVTHDTILAAFIYCLMGKKPISEDDWPWMMEGAWLWFESGHTVHWLWRGEHGHRDVAAWLAA